MIIASKQMNKNGDLLYDHDYNNRVFDTNIYAK